MDTTTLPALITGALLGQRVELRMKNGKIERGICVRVRIAHPRGLTIVDESAAVYKPALGAWLATRPREEREREHADIEQITVVDVIETKTVAS